MSFDQTLHRPEKLIPGLVRGTLIAIVLWAFCRAVARADDCTSSLLDYNAYESCKQSTCDLGEGTPLRSVNGKLDVKLVAKVAQNTITFAGGTATVETATYDGKLVGPTIRVRRRDRLRITVENRLQAAFCELKPPVQAEDFPHEFCVTNLHTHGLHISPKDPADNIYVSIYPYRSHQFEYRIPENHPSGTFWYHPHRHGSVAMQLTGGMAGALIVEGDLDEIPTIKHARERVLVLQQIHITTASEAHCLGCPYLTDTQIQRPCPYDTYDKWGQVQPCSGSADASLLKLPLRQQRSKMRLQSRSTKAKDAPCPPIPPYAIINGQYAGTMTIAPGAVERWRFIHAGNDEGFNLAVVADPTTAQPDKLPLYEIAVDGLPRGKAVKKRSYIVYPGYRWDVLFRAPEKPGVYYLINDVLSNNQSIGGGTTLRQCLAKINVSGAAHSPPMPLPTDTELHDRMPGELKERIRDDEVGNRRWMLKFNFAQNPDAFLINGQEYAEERVDRVVRLGTAEEWRLESANSPTNAAGHPFHIHVNPFQEIVPGVTAGPFLTKTTDPDPTCTAPATDATKVVDLCFSSQAGYHAGDTITVTGLTASAQPFTSTTTVDATTTMGKLVRNLNIAMVGLCPSGFQAVLDAQGNVVLPTSGCGLVTISVSNQGGNQDPRWNWKNGTVDHIWRDTLLVPAGGAEVVRMRFRDFTGETVLHCHIVDHEDQGMMKNILILGPNDPMPVGEVRRKGQLHATRSPVVSQLLKGKAPEWRVPLVDAEGKRHTLAEFSNKKRVLVFFLGAGCQPCLEQLRALRDLRDQFDRQGITLIAIGSCAPRELVSVKKSVEDQGAVPFVFLADPESKVFEQYQLVDRRDSGLLHGVFCLSPAGDVIWQTGATATPYRNVLDTVNAFAAPAKSTQASLR
jgi:FtsP/CotA-like multicopper oxidase with cupredoxin domain/peroxiredoxin